MPIINMEIIYLNCEEEVLTVSNINSLALFLSFGSRGVVNACLWPSLNSHAFLFAFPLCFSHPPLPSSSNCSYSSLDDWEALLFAYYTWNRYYDVGSVHSRVYYFLYIDRIFWLSRANILETFHSIALYLLLLRY